MSGSKDSTGTGDSTPNKTIWGKMKDLKTHAAEAAFNEKVYLLLRALLKEEKNFDPENESDKNIQKECNDLYTTWENYLDNDPNSDNVNIQLPQLKEAYLKCEPLVEKKLKNYVRKRSGEMAKQGEERALKLRDKAIETTRKTKEQILKQSKDFATTASAQYEKAHNKLLQTAQTIKSKIHSLSGPFKEQDLDEQVEREVEASGLAGIEKVKYRENLKKFSKLPFDTTKVKISPKGSKTIDGGARLTRKRKRKRKKRKTRRNRKLN